MALTDNLISHWKFDEASGNAIDVVGGYDGVLTGTIGTATGILYATARHNAAADNYFEPPVSGLSTFDTGNDFSFVGWLYFDNQINYPTIIDRGYDGNFQLWVDSGGIGLNVYAPQLTGSSIGITVSNSTWLFVSLVRSTGILYMRVNNTGEVSAAWSTPASPQSRMVFFQQAVYDPASYHFEGRAQSWSWYNRALDSSELAEHYNSGAGLAYPFGGGATFIASPNKPPRQAIVRASRY